MRYIRTNSLKRLFSVRRQHSFDEQVSVPRSSDFTEQDIQVSHHRKPTWKCFSYEEILEATNGFSTENMVGKGGYAEVYKGVLEDGEAIAVKMLTQAKNDERKEKEFLTELGTLCHVCHPNVTSLLGCCIENGLYLIFQFSYKGSVASLLHDENMSTMDWKTRYKIAVGTAKGLHYLHTTCPRRIIHRDINASNILLSAEFEPQISDFGLAKWLPSQWTHHSIVPIEGTFGYPFYFAHALSLAQFIFLGYKNALLPICHRHLAPEYFMNGVVDEKTDVFAFGVFLLELISGKKPVDNSHQSLHGWAKPILQQGEMEKIIDPRLDVNYDVKQLSKLAFAASLCIRSSSVWRPTMTEVLEVIMGGEVDKEKWKMPKEEDEEKEFWGFEDLECECYSSFTTSPHETFSNGIL